MPEESRPGGMPAVYRGGASGAAAPSALAGGVPGIRGRAKHGRSEGDEPIFIAGDRVARGVVDVTHDPGALDTGGFWAVLVSFEGEVTCARFAEVRRDECIGTGAWEGPRVEEWTTSLGRSEYCAAVADIRARISAGDVYQANLCRVLSAPLRPLVDEDLPPNLRDLWGELSRGNPTAFTTLLRLPEHGIHVASASPELYLRRDGRMIESGPIKGTGRRAPDLGEKDRAENVMIVDLVRNDLGRICTPGSVTVPALCAVEHFPTLVHLVSTVRGELAAGVGWPQILAATFPPGSVSGAPKLAALEIIRALEPVRRGPYCGAIGWVDADAGTASLAVGIRTFWIAQDQLHFGTGAGITWGSDPAAEWAETELKAARLLALAEGMSRRGAREREAGARS